MREDEVMALIRYDELIISYGNALCTKYRLEHMRPMIRTRLRLIGRFLLEIKKINEGVTDFASVFTPDRFDAAVEAINALAGLDKTKQEYKSPSTAFEMGSQLKKCGKHLITMCIKSKDKNRKTEVQDFLKILEEELAVCINKTVMENQLQHKRLKKINLPTSQNIAGFNNYLNKKRQLFHKKLEAAFDYNDWKELASLTLISIQTFNRRRAGEVERMMVADFKNYQSMSSNNDPELLDNLSEGFKLKGKKYVHVEIRGKKSRGVAVLISSEVFKSCQLILNNREAAGVPDTNPYLFGIPGKSFSNAHLSACLLMRKYSEESGIPHPEHLRGTQLRKHIATQSAMMDLREHEVNDLANFMGHAEKIHREHYRIPVVTREIGRISQLLEMGVGDFNQDCFKNSDTTIVVSGCSSTNVRGTEDGIDTLLRSEKNSEHTDAEISDEPETYQELCSLPKDSWSENTDKFTTYGKERCTSPHGKISRRSWNTPEKTLVEDVFKDHIHINEIPSLMECKMAIKSSSTLESRTPTQLRAWVANQIKKKSTKTSKNRIYWTTEEKTIMEEVFHKNLRDGVLPGLKLCTETQQKYPQLKDRTPVMLKAWVNNTLRKKNKNQV